MLNQMNELMTDIREKIEKVTSVMNFLKSKVMSVGIAGLMSLIQSKKKNANNNKKNKK